MVQEFFSQKKIDLPEFNRLSIRSDFLNFILGKSDQNEVLITIDCTIVTETNNNSTDFDINHFIKVDYEENNILFELNLRDLKANQFQKTVAKIEIPASIFLEVATTVSDIYLEHFSGEFSLESINGNISLYNCGKGTISSVNGKIDLKNIYDNYIVQTVNGDITIESGIGGSLNINTENGVVKLVGLNYNRLQCKTQNSSLFIELFNEKTDYLEITTVNGDINLALVNNESGDFILQSNTGDIIISLAPDFLLNLDLTTEEGEIKVNMNTTQASEECIEKKHFFVSFRDDFLNLLATTGKGKIRIVELDHDLYHYIHQRVKKEQDCMKEKIDTDLTDCYLEEMENIEKPISERISCFISEEEMEKLINQSNDLFTKTKSGFIKFANKMSDLFSSNNSSPVADTHNISQEQEHTALMRILEMLENKSITAIEAEKLINSINSLRLKGHE